MRDYRERLRARLARRPEDVAYTEALALAKRWVDAAAAAGDERQIERALTDIFVRAGFGPHARQLAEDLGGVVQ